MWIYTVSLSALILAKTWIRCILLSVAILGLVLKRSFRQMELDISYFPPLTTEEHESESHSSSEQVATKEHSTTEHDPESYVNDEEVTDQVDDKSDKELQIQSSATILQTRDQQHTEEESQPINDRKEWRGSAIHSINSSEKLADKKGLGETERMADPKADVLNEIDKQRYC